MKGPPLQGHLLPPHPGQGPKLTSSHNEETLFKKNSHIVKPAQCPKVKISRHPPFGLLFHPMGLVSGLLYEVGRGCLPHSQK